MRNTSVLMIAASLAAACMIYSSCSRSESAGDPRCAEIEKRFDGTLAAASGSCAADAECACYGQVTTKSRCGGVTDSKTASALAAIAKEYYALKCPRYYRCAAWKCVPACYRGTCVTDRLKQTMEKNSGRQQR